MEPIEILQALGQAVTILSVIALALFAHYL